MKKKLISLVLAMVMIVACFAGCGQKGSEEAAEDINKAASENAMTLVMYLLADEEVSAEKAAAIQTAVNRITKSKFKTQLELRFYTEDEYYEKLDSAFADRKTAEANGQISNNAVDETAEDETFENKWGVVEIAYPKVNDYQVDIFYIGDTEKASGYDKYNEYVNASMLQRLDEELASSSKLLSSYITPSILKGMKEAGAGSTYAIPNNFVIGEYTYLLINKQALEDFSYDTDKGLANFTSLTADNVKMFLSDIQEYKLKAGVNAGYTHALYSNISQVELASSGVHYWGTDEEGNLSDEFSALASNVNPDAIYGQKSSYLNDGEYVMTDVLNTKFTKQLRTIKEYKEAYEFDSAEAKKAFEEGKVAVACINGGATLPEMYADDYEAVVIGKPTLKVEDLYKNMFAVSSYSSSLSRSMEIVTYLNTNEDFRNLIQYGICDTEAEILDSDGKAIKERDYKIVESDFIDPATGTPYMVVERIPNDEGKYDYVMDVNRTGNTFIAYFTVNDNPSLLDYYKKQNNDAVIDLTLGFTTDYNGYKINTEALKELRTLSEYVLGELLKCKVTPSNDEEESYDEVVTRLREELSEEGEKGACIRALQELFKSEEDPDAPCGLAFIYNQWGASKKICSIAKPEE